MNLNPKYNYYKKEDKIIIKVEAPGNICNINTSFKSSEGYQIIKISGEKKK